MKRHTDCAIAVVMVLALMAGALALLGYSGLYNIGADDHHWARTHSVMQLVRDRSIHTRSEHIQVPNLDDRSLVLKGAGQYAAMCTSCHLQPGTESSELREGMYPQPPNLSKTTIDPRDAFWVIKHGIKMSGMPAWGKSHDNDTIWSMVAFLEKLPGMTPEQYKDIISEAPPDEDMDTYEGAARTDHHHDAGSDPDHHDGTAMPGMAAAARMPGMAASRAASSSVPLKPGGSPGAEAAAEAFQNALIHGDRAAVLALLHSDARISEDGSTQSRAEYAAHHLGEDIAFLKRAQIRQLSRISVESGSSAQVVTESETRITSKGMPAIYRSHEAMRLRRVGGDWKIVSIDWSSQAIARPNGGK